MFVDGPWLWRGWQRSRLQYIDPQIEYHISKVFRLYILSVNCELFRMDGKIVRERPIKNNFLIFLGSFILKVKLNLCKKWLPCCSRARCETRWEQCLAQELLVAAPDASEPTWLSLILDDDPWPSSYLFREEKTG